MTLHIEAPAVADELLVEQPPPKTMPALRAKALTLGYRSDRVIVDDLNLDLPSGAVRVIIGANGSGKSTLVRALSRLLAPLSGAVYLGVDQV